jgi:hypothetical protein
MPFVNYCTVWARLPRFACRPWTVPYRQIFLSGILLLRLFFNPIHSWINAIPRNKLCLSSVIKCCFHCRLQNEYNFYTFWPSGLFDHHLYVRHQINWTTAFPSRPITIQQCHMWENGWFAVGLGLRCRPIRKKIPIFHLFWTPSHPHLCFDYQ